MNKSTFLKIAIILSLVAHLLAGLLIYFIPPEKKAQPKPFVTRLVAPDELPDERQSGAARVPSVKSPPPSAASSARTHLPRPSVPERQVLPQTEARQQPSFPPQNMREAGVEGSKGVPSMPRPSSEGQGSAAIPPRPGSPQPGEIKRPPPPTLREKLFDTEVVEKLAKKDEEKKDNSITFDTDEFKYRTYMLRLKEKIESIWTYPPDAAMAGIHGDLIISFTIKKNGMLGDIELVRTSGHRSLDEAAQQALKDAQPFWPLPKEWGKDSLPITGHFVYSIYGTYIR
ncbi:MAG: TonB family protein [Thermodesulfovibrionales bacterium]|jgi:protein TonB